MTKRRHERLHFGLAHVCRLGHDIVDRVIAKQRLQFDQRRQIQSALSKVIRQAWKPLQDLHGVAATIGGTLAVVQDLDEIRPELVVAELQVKLAPIEVHERDQRFDFRLSFGSAKATKMGIELTRVHHHPRRISRVFRLSWNASGRDWMHGVRPAAASGRIDRTLCTVRLTAREQRVLDASPPMNCETMKPLSSKKEQMFSCFSDGAATQPMTKSCSPPPTSRPNPPAGAPSTHRRIACPPLDDRTMVAMARSFADLQKETISLMGGEQQAAIRRLLPERAAEHCIHIWKPGDPITAYGVRILVGITEWNPKDLEFLDTLLERRGDACVEIFLLADCRSQDDIALRVPDIGNVFQPPVLGVWRDGTLIERAQGGAVWKWLARR